MVSRIGCSYGLLEYKTKSIPTLGASNDGPHMEPIMRVEKMLEENFIKIRMYKKFF